MNMTKRLSTEASKALMRDIKAYERNLWVSILLSTDKAPPLLSQHLTGSDLALLTGLPETAESMAGILLSIDPNKKILEKIYHSLDPLPKEVTHTYNRWISARNNFVTANIGLIHYLVPVWIKEKPFYEDVIQEGAIGLITAVNRFDLNRDVCFFTYAKFWVQHYIRRYLEKHLETIRKPVHFFEERKKASRVRARHYAQHGYDPLPEEVAEEIELDVKRVNKVDAAFSWGVISTDQINGDGTVGDCLPSLYPSVDELIDEKKLYESLDRLGDRDRDILVSRLFEGETMKSIGDRYSVSRQAIEQIQKSALRKLPKFASKAA